MSSVWEVSVCAARATKADAWWTYDAASDPPRVSTPLASLDLD